MDPIDVTVPPELDYIIQACRAVSSGDYREAISLMKEGLRETSGIAETVDTSLFVALLRTLVVDIELRADRDLGAVR